MNVRDKDMPAAAARPVHERHRSRHRRTALGPGTGIPPSPRRQPTATNLGNASQPAHDCGRSPAAALAQDIAMVLQQIGGDGYELDCATVRQGGQTRRQPVFQSLWLSPWGALA